MSSCDREIDRVVPPIIPATPVCVGLSNGMCSPGQDFPDQSTLGMYCVPGSTYSDLVIQVNKLRKELYEYKIRGRKDGQ